MTSFIWKPSTISSWKGGVAFLAPDSFDRSQAPVITDASGKTYTGKYINTNEGRSQWIFPSSLAQQKDLKVAFGGQTGAIPFGSQSFEGGSLADWQARAKGSIGDPGSSTPGEPIPGTNAVFPFTANPGMIQFMPVTYNPITAAPFNFTDPIEAAKRYAGFNLEQEGKAYQTSLGRGRELFNFDQELSNDFARNSADLQKELVAGENAFNQAQRLQAVDFALPGARQSLEGRRGRAEALASGRLPNAIEDRAYEIAARSAAADSAFTRGFGGDSLVAKRTSDLLSAEQRLGLSQQGENNLSNWLTQASQLLVDTPFKANISQQIQANPRILPSQLSTQQQANLTNLSTVPVQFGISSEINQEQFRTNLEQGTRTFNASNTLQADEFNSSGAFNASVAQFNATQGVYDRVNGANQLAQDQIRQEAQAQAASTAAQSNIAAQQAGQNAGAVGQIIGAGIGLATGGFFSTGSATEAAGAGANIVESVLNGVSDVFGLSAQTSPAPASGQQIVTAQAPSGGGPQVPLGQTVQIPQQGAASAPAVPAERPSARLVGPADPQFSAQQVSQGMSAVGNLTAGLGKVGTPAPHFETFGSGLRSSSAAAQEFVSSGQSADAVPGRMALVNKLEQTAVNNAPTAAEAQNVQQIYKQVKDSVNTGAPATGAAEGISDYVNNFDNFSEAQKVRGFVNASFAGTDLANRLGVKDLTGQEVEKIPIPGTGNAMTLGNAVTLAKNGYNVYPLVDNWDELNEIQESLGGSTNVLSVANTARTMGFLGNSTPETQAALGFSLDSIGAQPAPSYGIGAIAVPGANAASLKDLGYTVTTNLNAGSQVVAVPNSVLASSGNTQGIVGTGDRTTAAQTNGQPGTQGVAGISPGAFALYQGWGSGGARGSVNGPTKNSPIAAGMYTLGAGGGRPALGQVLLSKNAVLGSKSGAQASRDAYRVQLRNTGVTDDDFNITLADGSKFNIGVDGHGGQRDWHNTNFIRPDQQNRAGGKLNAWDVDYTRDLDAITQLAGNGLALAIYGNGFNVHTHQMGNYFTNAAISNARTPDLTKAGFSTAMQNMKAMYASAGIESKDDAYKLSNQLYHEGRIDQTQAIQMQQGINLVFDGEKGFNAANELLEGVKLGRQGLSAPGKPETVQDSTMATYRKPRPGEKFPTVKPGDNIDPGFAVGAGEFNLPMTSAQTRQQAIANERRA